MLIRAANGAEDAMCLQYKFYQHFQSKVVMTLMYYDWQLLTENLTARPIISGTYSTMATQKYGFVKNNLRIEIRQERGVTQHTSQSPISNPTKETTSAVSGTEKVVGLKHENIT